MTARATAQSHTLDDPSAPYHRLPDRVPRQIVRRHPAAPRRADARRPGVGPAVCGGQGGHGALHLAAVHAQV